MRVSARVAVSPSQHDISNLKIRSAKTLVRQMGHLEVDITFGMIHLWWMESIRRLPLYPKRTIRTCNRKDVHRKWPLVVSLQMGAYCRFCTGTEWQCRWMQPFPPNHSLRRSGQIFVRQATSPLCHSSCHHQRSRFPGFYSEERLTIPAGWIIVSV